MEIKHIRKHVGKKFIIVTPGIRLDKLSKKNDDQKRIMTPKEAVSSGANFLVIGRPITKSNNPIITLRKINNSLN